MTKDNHGYDRVPCFYNTIFREQQRLWHKRPFDVGSRCHSSESKGKTGVMCLRKFDRVPEPLEHSLNPPLTTLRKILPKLI